MYYVLVLKGSDLIFFLHVWDFGKTQFDGTKDAFGNASSRYDVLIDSLEKLHEDRAHVRSEIVGREQGNGGIVWMPSEFWGVNAH